MEISDFFKENTEIAVAFSGGTDSSYLLYAARQNGAEVGAYCVKSQFQPAFELSDAQRLCLQLGVKLRVLDVDILSCDEVTANDEKRCYYCKKRIFTAIKNAAETDGFDLLCDGTNASDNAEERPGMKALAEMGVRSPLRECGLTKSQVRELSRQGGLFTADKPAYACLATRIPLWDRITSEKLEKTEMAESFLSQQGFSDFRVRYNAGAAKIQLKEEQLGFLLEKREEIFTQLKKYYNGVTLDLEVRR